MAHRTFPRVGSARLCFGLVAIVILFAITPEVRSQVLPIGGSVPGVYIDTDGVIHARQEAPDKPHAAKKPANNKSVEIDAAGLTYVSLPKLFAEVKTCIEAGKPVPEQLTYLGGLTRIQYLIVLPEEHDLLLAGPGEPWDVTSRQFATGKTTGRPVMQLDDFVVLFRQGNRSGPGLFGCKINPPDDSLKKSEKVAADMLGKPRKDRMEALRTALGPQKVEVFGTMEDTRLAFSMIAADYKMKRLGLGADKASVAGLGVAVDNSRSGACQIWFEPAYDPIRVSKDGTVYELRGNRLRLQAGSISFDPRGATPVAKQWAETFSAKMPQMAVAEPLIADLQNIADLGVVAALIRTDRLADKAGWDTAWLRGAQEDALATAAPKFYDPARIPSPRFADTVVNYAGGSIVCGGVVMEVSRFVNPDARQPDPDESRSTAAARQQATELRKSSGSVYSRAAH